MLLQTIAIALTINNHNFHKSKYVNSANAITGAVYEKTSNFSDYLALKVENEALHKENTLLKNKLDKNNFFISDVNSVNLDSATLHQKYKYVNAKIIKNSYSSESFNYLTINSGKNKGVDREMAVINSKGIIGITDNTSKNYARVQSVLNRSSKINARLKNKTAYFGTLSWDGKNYNIVQLKDIPRQAQLKIGDTIETGGMSTIFPEGILIGSIISSNNGNTADNKIDVKLFNDMSNLRHVYVVKNLHKEEIQSLENLENE